MSDARTIYLPQDVDTPASTRRVGSASLLYTSARSQEALEADLPNEDFLGFRYDERRLAFALCDGVGQSFHSELASRFLGMRLIDWLWSLPDGSARAADQHAATLFKFLGEWVAPGKQFVADFPLPDGIPALHRRALIRKREGGSACVFLCGRIDSGPGGVSCVVFWLGNVRARLWGAPPDWRPPADAFDSRWQWSTVKGPINTERINHLAVPSLSDSRVNQITVYTDGVGEQVDSLRYLYLSPDRLDALIRGLRDAPQSDDVSVLHIEIETPENG
jgi:hypothetical protein